jgi:hypothetical protein
MFLWALFSGDWSQHVHGIGDFVRQIVIATGLWVPLIVLFVVRGLLMMFDIAEPWLRRAFRLAARAAPPATLSPSESLLGGLYARIIVMHVTILFGAWCAMLIGTTGAYLFLIAIKTSIDVAVQRGSGLARSWWPRAQANSTGSPTP